jgi:hypothetical protein
MALDDRARRGVWLAVAGLALVALVLLLWPNRVPEPTAMTPTSPSTKGTAITPPPAAPDLAANAWMHDAGPDAPRLTIWESRLAQAQHVLDNYVNATRYPPYSRPMSEHPDLTTTARPVNNQLGFKRKSGPVRSDLRLHLAQSSQRIIGDEKLVMTVSCNSAKGIEPSEVVSARSVEVPPKGKAPTAITFVDDGTNGDEQAKDNVWTATFQPATSAQFAGYNGYINVPLDVKCGGDEATTFFDFFYTASEPARFTGNVREEIEQGSLALYLEFDVKKAGIYKLDLRVDDTHETKLAFVSFDAALAVGTQWAKFVVFGKLILDYASPAPFKLRDLDGYLFIPDTDPDRENIKPRAGYLYTTKAYAKETFSDTEWSSEEKDRHIKEFTKDVAEARAKVNDEQTGKIPKQYAD